MDNTISRLERAHHWLVREHAIFEGKKKGPNEFDLYVPVEVREKSISMRNKGFAPPFCDTDVKLWVALSEVMGIEKFVEPLGWDVELVKTHLFGL